MERYSDDAMDILNALHTERLEYSSEYLPLAVAITQLAAYEDTGATPEECATAIRAQRENPKPLTLEQLRQMDGQKVFVPKSEKYYDGIGIVNASESRVDDEAGAEEGVLDKSCGFEQIRRIRTKIHKCGKE